MRLITTHYLCGLLLTGLLSSPALAVRVDAIYSADVELPAAGGTRAQAFDAALSIVLVKVSGVAALGEPAARRSLVPDAGRIVRQFSRLPDNRLRVEFDAAAVRAALDAAGQPVWGADRPLVAVWYAVDEGTGQRELLADDNLADTPQGQLRDALAQAAEGRGLPVVFPLMDAVDLATVTFSDVWGGFAEPVLEASQRYGAQAVLIGRARSATDADTRVRWLLVTPTERVAWEGPAAAGPLRAAETLAQGLATYANAGGTLRLQVDGVTTLERFGRLQNYLRGLGVVRSAQVTRVRDNRIEFELVVRGDAARLSRSLDSDGLLARGAGGTAGDTVTAGRRPDLVYTWAAE